jgi:hypothetical protein
MNLMTFNSRAKLYISIAAVGCGLFAACDDDNESDVVSPSADTREVLQADEYAFRMVCAELFNAYDTLYTAPAVGEALDGTRPTVLTTGVADEAAARSFFDHLCVDADRCATLEQGIIRYDLGTYGALYYHPSDSDGILATLDVDLLGVSSLTQLRFISQDRWPSNAAPPFELGDVVRDNVEGYVWVCVQEYGAGLPALFLTFDEAQVSQLDETLHLRYRQCAGFEALREWYYLLQSGRTQFTAGTEAHQRLAQVDLSLYDAVDVAGHSYAQVYSTGARMEQAKDDNLYMDLVGAPYHLIAMTDASGVPAAEDLQFVCASESETHTSADVSRYEMLESQIYGHYDEGMEELYEELQALWEQRDSFLSQYAATVERQGGDRIDLNEFVYLYHTGVVTCGGRQWNLKQQLINKRTQSVSSQNVQLMQTMFTKVDC